MAKVLVLIKSTAAILVLYGLTICALVVGYANQFHIANESGARAAAIEDQNAAIQRQALAIENQNQRLRFAFCGIVEPYGNLSSPPSSEGAKTLRDSFKNAASDEGLGCTPDPTDGR